MVAVDGAITLADSALDETGRSSSKKHHGSWSVPQLMNTPALPRKTPAALPRLANSKVSVRMSRDQVQDDVLKILEVIPTSNEELVSNAPLCIKTRLVYKFENLASTSPSAYFFVLLIATAVATLLMSLIICLTIRDDIPFVDALFLSFSVVTTQGIISGLQGPAEYCVYIALIVIGLTAFAILIGMITEAFEMFVEAVNAGRSTVPLSDHTLILGWNETTVRVVCQIAFLREQYQQQNASWIRRVCWWKRVRPSTPVSASPVVILTNQRTKAEMEEAIKAAFDDAGVSTRRNVVGCDIVCRVGDPQEPRDLKRVGAHRARAILTQMTDADYKEESDQAGQVSNGATLRSLLALRMVLFTADQKPQWEDLRVVAQMARPSKAIEVVQLGESSIGRPILKAQDLSIFMNSLLFTCAVHPGIGFTLITLLSFDGPALRLRKVTDFPDKGRNLIGLTVRETACMWEDAVLVGVASERVNAFTEALRSDEGFAPHSERVITEDDRIILVCRSSVPKPARTFPTAISGVVASRKDAYGDRVSILICGWRSEWDDPQRFAYRIRCTCADLPRNSRLTFLCTRSRSLSSWDAFMQSVSEVDPDIMPHPDESGTYTFNGYVSVSHAQGDACIYEDLEAVLKRRVVDKVIVMSSSENADLGPASRDTRLMSIMLFLRHLQVKLGGHPFHVIGENALDSTSLLAICPSSEHGEIPDFVNVHAIYACALAQSLAYPRMQPYVDDLFSPEGGSPSLRIVDAMRYLPHGTFSFASITQHLKQQLPDVMLIGMRKANGQLLIVPKLSDTCTCEAGTRLIIVTRGAEDAHSDGRCAPPRALLKTDDLSGFGLPGQPETEAALKT
eukprot:TRINITY_DN26552_c0_g1_i3.p1 TRINITY_DN26552_c0_g1~~TRINITY_DN26552_c0_g1_i3.p1  ORF type:complete len:849 (-),score=74.42 TRINITY_DN26552_c0_g1_i3:484-3030(-)